MTEDFQEGQWRTVRRTSGVGYGLLQPMVFKHGAFIPLGPWADDEKEMRKTLQNMLAAIDAPLLTQGEGVPVH
jgi:hypothetical protein